MPNTLPRPPAATVSAEALQLVLVAHRMRRYNRGRTCQLCALSARPLIQVDCASNSEHTRPGLIAEAQRLGASRVEASPMLRGHIARLYERTRLWHGRAEVLRTWRAGIRALQGEPRHVLNGGKAA